MATDTRKVGLGVVLLVLSSVLIFAFAYQGLDLPLVVGSVAALGLAAGSLLVGISEGGRPV
jgi:hypothetical protein